MPVYNHPVTIRLAPTNYVSQGSNTPVYWSTFVDPAFMNRSHGVPDGVFPDFLIRAIPNNLYDIKNLCDEPENIDVAVSQDLEIQNSTANPKRPADFINQGGAYIDDPRGLLTQTVIATPNAKNTLNVSGHVSCFVDLARPNGGTAFNIFMHGQCDREGDPNALYESSTISAPATGFDTEGFFDDQDPTISSYVTFKSSDAPTGTSITSNLISFRKSLHYNFLKLNRADMAGLSMASGTNAKAFVTASSSFDWSNVPGLSAESVCTINEFTSPSSEQATASGGNPPNITCLRWNGVFEGIFGTNARFRNSTSNSLFRTPTNTYDHTGKINASNPLYAEGDSNPYTLSTVETTNASKLTIRMRNAFTYGDKNYLAIGPRNGGGGGQPPTPRLNNFPVGSYIRIRGSLSNNGIYQVVGVSIGITGDSNSNTSIGGTPQYEYLELSRAIVPELAGANITVENVSDLPILHIKYRELVQS
jgi:hypothetical protein